MDVIVNTIRKIDHDQVKEHAFGNNTTLKENLALALINPEDLKKMNHQSNMK